MVSNWGTAPVNRVEVFRPRGFVAGMRGAALACLVMFTAVAISGPGPAPDVTDRFGTVAFGVAFALGWWRAARMRLEADDGGVTVFGYFDTRSASWSEITGFVVNYGGLHVLRADGRHLTAKVLGKANWQTWLGRKSRNDEIAEHLTALLEDRR